MPIKCKVIVNKNQGMMKKTHLKRNQVIDLTKICWKMWTVILCFLMMQMSIFQKSSTFLLWNKSLKTNVNFARNNLSWLRDQDTTVGNAEPLFAISVLSHSVDSLKKTRLSTESVMFVIMYFQMSSFLKTYQRIFKNENRSARKYKKKFQRNKKT